MTTQKMIMYFDMDSVYEDQLDDMNPSDGHHDYHDENSTIASVDSNHHNGNRIVIIDNEAENDEGVDERDTEQKKTSSVNATAQLSEPDHHQCSPGSQTVRKRKRAITESSFETDTFDVKKPIFNLEMIPRNPLSQSCMKASRKSQEASASASASPPPPPARSPSRTSCWNNNNKVARKRFDLHRGIHRAEDDHGVKQGNWVYD